MRIILEILKNGAIIALFLTNGTANYEQIINKEGRYPTMKKSKQFYKMAFERVLEGRKARETERQELERQKYLLEMQEAYENFIKTNGLPAGLGAKR